MEQDHLETNRMPIEARLKRRVKKVGRFSFENDNHSKNLWNQNNYFTFLLISTLSENTLEYSATDWSPISVNA